jgi:Fic family protein
MTETAKRTYLETHPWLTFRLDLRQAPYDLWMLLGEARSKMQHLGESLLAPETGEQLRQVYLAKGVHATTAIEGNTLSEEEVVEHLAGRLRLPPSQAYRAREIDNIVTAYNQITAELRSDGSRDLTAEKIKHYNRLILDGLAVDEGVIPGELAIKRPAVGRYLAPAREDGDYLLERLCEWLNGDDFAAPDEELAIPYAIIKAVIAHLYLAWIHYFGDGNGRTARCVELQILFATGQVPTPAVHLLSNHYNTTRDEYYRQLDAASRQHDGSPIAFLVYAVRGLVDGLRQQLGAVWIQLCSDRWEQYIYQQFGDGKTPPHLRQRQLVLDLSKHTEPVPRSKLRDLSPKVALAYADRGEKTLTRDLNALVRRDLIVPERSGYRPRREKILALLPNTAPPPPEMAG